MPAKNRPAPRAATPTPRSNIAAPNNNIAGITGVNKAAATPNTKNAPANANNAIPTPSKLIPESNINGGTNNAIAIAATIKAAEPARVPVIKYRPAANIAKDPPNAKRPVPTCSRLNPPKEDTALASILTPTAAINRPAPITSMSGGIALKPRANMPNAPANPRRPFTI